VSRAGPALEEPIAVPGVLVVGSPPRELHDPLGEVAIAHLLGEQQLATAQLLRAPEEVVPELVRQLVEPLLTWPRPGRDGGGLEGGKADAVVEDENPRASTACASGGGAVATAAGRIEKSTSGPSRKSTRRSSKPPTAVGSRNVSSGSPNGRTQSASRRYRSGSSTKSTRSASERASAGVSSRACEPTRRTAATSA
jgi:hypothetical protein